MLLIKNTSNTEGTYKLNGDWVVVPPFATIKSAFRPERMTANLRCNEVIAPLHKYFSNINNSNLPDSVRSSSDVSTTKKSKKPSISVVDTVPAEQLTDN